MAATPKIKLDRKALREPDEFHLVGARATEWIVTRRRTLMAAAGVTLVLVLALLGASWSRARQRAAAGIRFSAAHAEFLDGRHADAATSFDGLHRDYGDTPFGRLALLYRGHALARGNDPAGAAAAYEAFLARGLDAEYLRQEALVGLGQVRVAGGDPAGARAAFAEAAEIAGPFRTEARLALARLAESEGDSQGARELYAAILGELPEASPLRAFLQNRLGPSGGSQRP